MKARIYQIACNGFAAASVVIGIAAYQSCFSRPPLPPNEDAIEKQVRRLRSGPSLEDALRKLGEDPADMTAPDDGGEIRSNDPLPDQK